MEQDVATIPNLTETTDLSASDEFVIKTSSSSTARKISAANVKAYMNEGVVATDDKVVQFSAPVATGFTVTINDGPDSIWLVLTPDAGYAAGTITLPAVANCVDKQEILVNSTQAITTLTISGNGATVVGGPSAMRANAFFRLKFESVLSKWYRVG